MEETIQLLKSDSKCHDEENDNEHVFVAFARVFSGAVRQGQRLYVLGPKHDPGVALIQVQLLFYHHLRRVVDGQEI